MWGSSPAPAISPIRSSWKGVKQNISESAEQMPEANYAFKPAETVRSFREVLDGKHDDLPESAFFLKGSIDDVVEAAKKS